MGDSPRAVAFDGTVLGIRPDGPEADVFTFGDLAVWNCYPEPMPVVVMAQEDCWVEFIAENGWVGFVRHERELGRREPDPWWPFPDPPPTDEEGVKPRVPQASEIKFRCCGSTPPYHSSDCRPDRRGTTTATDTQES
jgi:hypothetical protein